MAGAFILAPVLIAIHIFRCAMTANCHFPKGKMRACIFGNEDAGSFGFTAGLDPPGTLEKDGLLFVK